MFCIALQTSILNKYNQGEFRAATDALNQIYSFVATKIEEIELGQIHNSELQFWYNINSQILQHHVFNCVLMKKMKIDQK